MDNKDLEATVRGYALDHYNEAFVWSALVEATTRDELADELAQAGITTLVEAIAHYTGVGEVYEDRIADARNSI